MTGGRGDWAPGGGGQKHQPAVVNEGRLLPPPAVDVVVKAAHACVEFRVSKPPV
jgi:hypothetical protein